MADEAPPILLKNDNGAVYTAPDKATALEAMRYSGMSPATVEDAEHYETRSKHLQFSERAKAAGVGLLSMGTVGLADQAIEEYAPGYLKEIEEHNAFSRGIGEFLPLLAASLLTGGGAAAARGAVGAGAATVGRTAAMLRTAGKANPLTAGIRAGQKLEGHLLAKGASPAQAFLGNAVADEMVLGTLLGTQQGFKQSAIEGADWDRAMAGTVAKHLATGAILGAGFGVGRGALNYRQARRALAGGLEARGVEKGTADATAENLLGAQFQRAAAQPGKEKYGQIWEWFEPHMKEHGSQATMEVLRTQARREKDALLDKIVTEMDQVFHGARDLDMASRGVVKPQIVENFAKNINLTRGRGSVTPANKAIADEFILSVDQVRSQMYDVLDPYVHWVNPGAKLHDGRFTWKRFGKADGRKGKPIGNRVMRENMEQAVKSLSQKSIVAAVERYGGTKGLVMMTDDVKRALFANVDMQRHFAKGKWGELTHKLTNDVYDPLKAILENKAFVGKDFGKFQELYNEGTWAAITGSSWRETKKNLGKKIDRTKGRPWEDNFGADRVRTSAAVNTIGKEGSVSAFTALEKGLAYQRQRAQAIVDLAASNPGIKFSAGPVDRGWGGLVNSAHKTIKAIDEISANLNQGTVGALYPKILASNTMDAMKALDETPLLSGNLLGILPLGAAARGAVGAYRGMGGGIRNAVVEAGMSASGIYSHPHKVLMTTGRIFDAMQSRRSTVEGGLNKFFSGAEKAPGVAGRSRGRVSKGFHYSRALLTNQQVDYEKTVDELQQKNSDPQKAEDEILESLEGLGNSGSDFRIGAVSKAKQIREYLLSIAPTESMNTFILGRRRPVSRMESETFNRVKNILENPEQMVKRMADNRLTMDEVRAVKTIYPEWYKEMQLDAMGAMMELAEKGETLPFAKRLGLWRYLGIPTDPLTDTAFIRYMTMEYAKDRKKQPKPPPQSQKKSRLAESYESESQKTEEGVGAR